MRPVWGIAIQQSSVNFIEFVVPSEGIVREAGEHAVEGPRVRYLLALASRVRRLQDCFGIREAIPLLRMTGMLGARCSQKQSTTKGTKVQKGNPRGVRMLAGTCPAGQVTGYAF